MFLNGEDWQLAARHFVVNIQWQPVTASGIALTNRDPRKQRKKPGAYIGVVEEMASSCQLVQIGARVVFERWEWQQMNLDDARMIVHERDLLVVNDTTPAPNVIVMELLDKDQPRTALVIPDTLQVPDRTTHHGKIIATQAPLYFGEVGDELIVEHCDSGQYKDEQGRFFFRVGRYAEILVRIRREKTLQLAVI